MTKDIVRVELGKEQELRDEFRCPITQVLLRVPVMAADGHSYERSAMERWLENHTISPKTGELLEDKRLVPNHNLKRLIEDLVEEGGLGLYSSNRNLSHLGEKSRLLTPRRTPPAARCTTEDSSQARSAVLKTEPLLLLQCLDPPTECGACKPSFEVSTDGIVGGRQRERREDPIKIMPFSESTVSRRHFEIRYAQEKFWLMDLGSASGTFLRLRPGAKAPLTAGSMFMLGKHQLVVLSQNTAAPLSENDNNLVLECFAPDGSPLQHQLFCVNRDGATLGRRMNNTIAFAHQPKGSESMGVDAAISSEHARIEAEVISNKDTVFFLRDGATPHGRLSTNGTWIRLSSTPTMLDDNILHRNDLITNPPPPPHFPKGALALQSDDEFLVGTIRFHVALTHSIVELDDDAAHSHKKEHPNTHKSPCTVPPPPPHSEEKDDDAAESSSSASSLYYSSTSA